MTARLVVDANVVAKLYLRDGQEPWLERVDELFSRFARGEIEIVAPRLILYEVPAAIRNAVKGGRIPENDALDAVQRFERLPLPVIEETTLLLEEAFRLANTHRCSFYDAVYLQLAVDIGWAFITADDKLCRELRGQLAFITPLRSFH